MGTHAVVLILPASLRSALPMQVYISNKWKFIYIRQPKSSSSTILEMIRSWCKGRCSRDDLHAVDNVSDDIWKSYFVFTFVRNPWTRMLSAYGMFQRHHLRRYALSAELIPRTAAILSLSCYNSSDFLD